MPVVNIKGVGPAQFPDGMSAEDIRAFLRRKYSQDMGATDVLAPMPATAQPYEPTLPERMGQGLSDALYDTGVVSDRYGAQQVGSTLSSIGEMLPVIGDAAAGDEFGRAAAKDDYSGMALAGLGVMPVVGDVLKQTLRKVKSIDLPAGKLGSDQYKIIKQSDPKAKAKTNPDGSVNVTYLDEYQPKQLKGALHEFDPDALELTEGTFKNTATYKGDKNKPITVTKEHGNYIVLDGHHRSKLAKEEGRKVKAVVIPIDDVASMKKDNIHQADMLKEWIARGDHKKESQSSIPAVGNLTENTDFNAIKKLPYREKAKLASEWQTGQPIKLSFARNKESSKDYPAGMDFGQKIEPSGRYMNVEFDSNSLGSGTPGWEYGDIEFNNPIVLEHKSTNSTGWKKDLSEMFGGSTGKRLTTKIKKAGHDGIITRDADGFNETVSLK